jgi:hypothetical protein
MARVGSTGNDEHVVEPSDNPKSNNLEAIVTPKRRGKLPLYVNKRYGLMTGIAITGTTRAPRPS